jgi:acyl transferase domain-containing protein
MPMNRDVHSRPAASAVRDIEAELTQIWAQVLGIEAGQIDPDANFFALGGDSLLIVRVMDRVNALYFAECADAALPITHFFSHGTIRALATSLLSVLSARVEEGVANVETHTDAVAIIGMACRLPGAPDTEAFWRNLRDGVESIQRFSQEQLLEAGISPSEMGDTRYVMAGVLLDDVQSFDAAYFGLTAPEAALTSPEQRLLIECSEEALQHAGYGVTHPGERIGVFIGAGLSSYLLDYLASSAIRLESTEGMVAVASNTSAATRISYLLDLTGPSVTIDTACSSSLVAVHQACRAILSGECSMALAGGATVRAYGARGYRAEEGGIFAPDGHCRPFDRLAQGTVGSSGAGVVLLKRRSQAIADGDTIHAVILGTAVNNDGGTKVGYTAPSASAQASVIRSALAAAQVDASSIQYLETHGTATPLGDRIEIAALSEVFPASGPGGERCALGALKANIGHVEAAAGIAGLIKTTLALKHRQLPPAIHFREPGEAISGSGFRMSSQLTDWPALISPRRAGVSSFGIGGTNAHAILEEGEGATPGRSHRSAQLLIVSARSEPALKQSCRRLVEHLQADEQMSLADVAHTLQIGREAHAHRHFVVAASVSDAVRGLQEQIDRAPRSEPLRNESISVVFMFPGQGSQRARMAQGIYESEPVFREHMDRCAEILRPVLARDLLGVLYEGPAESLNETEWCQPALFAVEYSFARLWQSWGVQPSVMIGHSLGEYVAACVAGVWSLEDALRIVAARGRLMGKTRPGKMLALKLSRAGTERHLSGSCALAAVNGPSNCVVSGSPEDIERLKVELSALEVPNIELNTTRAFHSSLMDDILPDFEQALRNVTWGELRIPFVSNLTGKVITREAATSADYWIAHLRRTVDFAGGVQSLLHGDAPRLFLESGPGAVLASCVRGMPGSSRHCIVSSGGRAQETQSDASILMTALGRAWENGVEVDWRAFNAHSRCRRVPLPTYPFERERHWALPERAGSSRRSSTHPGRPALPDWFYVPFWRQKLRLASPGPPVHDGAANSCVIIEGPAELEDALGTRLSQHGMHLVRVRIADRFECKNGRYSVSAQDRSTYVQLFSHLRDNGLMPGWIVHAGEAHENPRSPDIPDGKHLGRGVLDVLDLCSVLIGEWREPVTFTLLTRGAHSVTGDEKPDPSRAMLAAVCRVITEESPNVECRNVDFTLPESQTFERRASIDALVQEMLSPVGDRVVAYRGSHRWVRNHEKLVPQEGTDDRVRLRERGAYLITGGLGGIGWTLAGFLARTCKARLILVGRSPFPERTEWQGLLDAGEEQGEICERIRGIRTLESTGAEVLVASGDVTCVKDMERIVDLAQRQFGGLHGVIHAAGVAGGGAIFSRTRAVAERVMAPKVIGTWVVHDACRKLDLDFMVCCSSLAAVLGPPGQYDYCAANAFQDAFCRAHDGHDGTRYISINWDGWSSVGMAVNTAVPASMREQRARELATAISCEEGARVFDLVLANPLPQWIVSTHGVDPDDSGRLPARRVSQASLSGDARSASDVPNGPGGVEAAVSRIWQDLLGVQASSADDDFFELGGDSLLAAQLRSRIESQFSRPLTLKALLADSTLRGMTRLLQENA